MAGLEAVFFDLGDTITDLGEGRGDYEMRVLARAGKVYDILTDTHIALPERRDFCQILAEGTERCYQKALAQQRGLTIHDALRFVFTEMDISIPDGLLNAGAEAYCGGAQTPAPLRKGAQEVLTQLCGRGLRLGVISNTLQPGRYLDASLKHKGILHYFAARIYSSEEGVAKPHPRIFQAALAALRVRSENAVHVGDRLLHDISGAQGVGMKAVLIRVAGRLEKNTGVVPDACIDELPELPEALLRLGLT